MGTNKNSSSSKILGLILLLPVLGLLWFLAPCVLPVWRWMNLDFKAIADKHHIPLSELTKEYNFMVRYRPRGPKDPVPWQLFDLQPPWNDIPTHEDEANLLLRVVFISDLTGTGPNEGYIGDSPKGQYFKGICWRLPKGSIPGVNKFHPILVYQGASNPMNNSEVAFWDAQLNNAGWRSNDEDIDDGYHAPDPGN